MWGKFWTRIRARVVYVAWGVDAFESNHDRGDYISGVFSNKKSAVEALIDDVFDIKELKRKRIPIEDDVAADIKEMRTSLMKGDVFYGEDTIYMVTKSMYH